MEQAEVLVTDVEWNLSKDGYMIPVVNFGGVRLDGVVIKRATGFNGKYIKDNKIGPGAKLIIIRSGQVIPYVKEVLKPSEPQMPEVPYVWSKSGVDIMLAKDQVGESTEVMKKNLENLFSKLDVAGMGPGTVKKLFDAGLTTPRAIFKATKADLLKADGIKEKSAEKIRAALDGALATLDCLKLMDASNVFGRGIGMKKLEAIVKTCPGILDTRQVPSIEELLAVKGIEKTTAEQFLSHLGAFFKFADDNDFKCASAPKIKKQVVGSPVPNVFADMKIVFSGIRDKVLEEFITNRGGTISTSVSKNTSIIVCKDPDEDSGKIKKARDLGVKIMSVEAFKKKYEA
jgi:NAD-dependent DNA ligase